MKKILFGITLITTLAIQNVQAESKAMRLLKEYGPACGVSLLAGLLLSDTTKNGTAIGVALCGGITTYGVMKDAHLERNPLSDEQKNQLDQMIAQSMNKLSIQKDQELTEKIKKVEEIQKTNIEEMKTVLKEVLAEKMIRMEEDMKSSVQQQLEQGTLIPKIEEKMKDAVKKEVVSEIRSRQKEIVEKAVEETIKQVVAKPIGINDNQSGLIEP